MNAILSSDTYRTYMYQTDISKGFIALHTNFWLNLNAAKRGGLIRLVVSNDRIIRVVDDWKVHHSQALLHQQRYGKFAALRTDEGLVDQILKGGATQLGFVWSNHHMFSFVDSMKNNVIGQFAENAAKK